MLVAGFSLLVLGPERGRGRLSQLWKLFCSLSTIMVTTL